MGRRSNTSDSRRYHDWLDYAEADITAALDLSDKEETYLCSAFHCQQAIEKTLKAYFLYEDGYAPDGHNVIFLCRKLSGKYREFEQWIDECIETNNYYIQTRYPPDKPLDITVAVMGCVVNGPGEAREADMGIAGGDGCGMLFEKGQMIEKLPYDELLPALLKRIEAM